jgi:hypothetical protein
MWDWLICSYNAPYFFRLINEEWAANRIKPCHHEVGFSNVRIP